MIDLKIGEVYQHSISIWGLSYPPSFIIIKIEGFIGDSTISYSLIKGNNYHKSNSFHKHSAFHQGLVWLEHYEKLIKVEDEVNEWLS